MITKFNVGDAVLVNGVVDSIYVGTVENKPNYCVRIRRAETGEIYSIRVNEDAIEGGTE